MINGTIKNYAKRRGVEIEVVKAEAIDRETDEVWFFDESNESEPVLMYTIEPGFLYYKGKLMKGLEDLPLTILNSTKLKELINYISAVLKEQK